MNISSIPHDEIDRIENDILEPYHEYELNSNDNMKSISKCFRIIYKILEANDKDIDYCRENLINKKMLNNRLDNIESECKQEIYNFEKDIKKTVSMLEKLILLLLFILMVSTLTFYCLIGINNKHIAELEQQVIYLEESAE